MTLLCYKIDLRVAPKTVLFYKNKFRLLQKACIVIKIVKDFDSSLPVRIFCLPNGRRMFVYIRHGGSIYIVARYIKIVEQNSEKLLIDLGV